MSKSGKPCSTCGSKRKKLSAATHVRHIGNTHAASARPSCIECVEKHLGAAWVLLDECHDGYPHRLLVIGHLHEAEDESRVWPQLHEAIRSARKLYQQEGAVPDFELLTDLLEAAVA